MTVDDPAPQLEQNQLRRTPPAAAPGDPGPTLLRGEDRVREAPARTPLRDVLLTRPRYPNGSGNSKRDPLDGYTQAEMPTVQDADPNKIYEYIESAVMDEWESYPGGKLVAIPFDTEVETLSQHDSIRGRIFTAASEIAQSRQAAVAAPIAVEEDSDPENVPSAFLIYNLTEEQREALLQQSVWSSVSITFRIVPLESTRPDYLFTLSGFTSNSEKLVLQMIDKVWNTEKTQNLLQKLTIPMDDEQDKPQPNIEDFTNSMWIEFVDIKGKNNTLLPHYNVFADRSLIPDRDLWNQIRTLLLQRPYSAISIGRGIAEIAPFTCGICHGATHPRGLCPFPDTPGWNGPARRPEDHPYNRGGSNRRGSSRGRRGRGMPPPKNYAWT